MTWNVKCLTWTMNCPSSRRHDLLCVPLQIHDQRMIVQNRGKSKTIGKENDTGRAKRTCTCTCNSIYFKFYFFIFRYNCTNYLLLFRRTSLATRVVHLYFYLLFRVMYLCIYLQARRVADVG